MKFIKSVINALSNIIAILFYTNPLSRKNIIHQAVLKDSKGIYVGKSKDRAGKVCTVIQDTSLLSERVCVRFDDTGQVCYVCLKNLNWVSLKVEKI